MKVIDLCKMRANKEEMPRHIIINRMNYYYNNLTETYIDENCKEMTLDFTSNVLNMPIEIIEEKELKPILKSYGIFGFEEKSFFEMKDMLQDVYSNQCKIIKAVNELRKEK